MLFIVVIIAIIIFHWLFQIFPYGSVFFRRDGLNKTSVVDMSKFPAIDHFTVVGLVP